MIVDANVSLSRWPARRLPDDETSKLVDRLRQQGVTRAWAGTFDALLHQDLAAANQRLAHACQTHGPGFLIPFGAVNLSLPAWQEDLRRCHEEHGMPGIRLHPNYHDYRLDAPAMRELCELASGRRLIVQIVVAIEDERTQHRLLRVPPVDLAPLRPLLDDFPQLKIVLLNSQRSVREDALAQFMAAGLVFADLAALEGVGGVARALRTVPLERVLFGSHAPFFHVESALLKLQESELGNFQREAILFRNAQRIEPR